MKRIVLGIVTAGLAGVTLAASPAHAEEYRGAPQPQLEQANYLHRRENYRRRMERLRLERERARREHRRFLFGGRW